MGGLPGGGCGPPGVRQRLYNVKSYLSLFVICSSSNSNYCWNEITRIQMAGMHLVQVCVAGVESGYNKSEERNNDLLL